MCFDPSVLSRNQRCIFEDKAFFYSVSMFLILKNILAETRDLLHQPRNKNSQHARCAMKVTQSVTENINMLNISAGRFSFFFFSVVLLVTFVFI